MAENLIKLGGYVVQGVDNPETLDLVLGTGVKATVNEEDKTITVGTDETLLWQGERKTYDADARGIVDAIASEPISNFECVKIFVNIGKDSFSDSDTWSTSDLVVTLNVIDGRVSWFYCRPENSYSGNWFKWFIRLDGASIKADGGHSSAATVGGTSFNGGLWGRGSLYKVVGINRKR